MNIKRLMIYEYVKDNQKEHAKIKATGEDRELSDLVKEDILEVYGHREIVLYSQDKPEIVCTARRGSLKDTIAICNYGETVGKEDGPKATIILHENMSTGILLNYSYQQLNSLLKKYKL